MPSINLTGLSEEEKSLIENRATNAGMSTAAFVRTRFRVAWRLWDAGGNFNRYQNGFPAQMGGLNWYSKSLWNAGAWNGNAR